MHPGRFGAEQTSTHPVSASPAFRCSEDVVPQCERSTNGATGVARCRLNPDPLERPLPGQAAVCDAVERDTPGHAEVLVAGEIVRSCSHPKDGLFGEPLDGGSEVGVPLGQRVVG